MPQRVLPPFSALPIRKDGPRGNAWGLFGEENDLGMLNLLTPETVMQALQNAKYGIRVPIDLPLGVFKKPFAKRLKFHQQIIDKSPRSVNDDVLTINTQSSSQWDGPRHYGYQDHKLFFNGMTEEDILNSTRIGTHVMVENGGIVSRGVLLDYYSWARSHDISPRCLEYTPIPISALREVAADQQVAFRQGDILFIRFGYVKEVLALPSDEAVAFTGKPKATGIGVESSEETLRWIWENGFAAVASDALAFEAMPFGSQTHWLHEWLLAGWGMPIGELFDLEMLAEECRKKNKWTFFFSSMPLHGAGKIGYCAIVVDREDRTDPADHVWIEGHVWIQPMRKDPSRRDSRQLQGYQEAG